MKERENHGYSSVTLESEKELLIQRYISFNTIFEEMKIRANEGDDQKYVAIIEDLFSQPKSWANIAAIQQTMVGLMTEDEINIDLEVRLIKSKGLLSDELISYYFKEKETKEVNKKKELLERLIRDVHWYSKVLDLEKIYVTRTRVRTGIIFILAIIFFFAVDQMPWLADLLNVVKGDKSDAILTAITSGVLGTCFSMLIGLKSRLSLSSISDLRILHRFDYITSRSLVGFVSGMILFYFFDSEIFKAPLFPTFNHTGAANEFLDNESMALLVVWCFVSGFSEKLVPDLLFKAGKSMGNSKVEDDVDTGAAMS